MAIYKMVGDKEGLVEVESTSFGQQGVLERSDLQRILRDQPDVLEEGLLIISEEFGNWQDSNRRIDLLGLDSKGRLVVVELKRGDTGGHMDLQAIRYAAMVANMTYQQTVDTYQAYLEKRASEAGETVKEDAAKTAVTDHLSNLEEGADAIHTEIPRIILASENFGKELTTCVMWLNDSWLREAGQEIKCVRLQPHRNGAEILIESSVVIPLPEASDYLIRVNQREQEIRSAALGNLETVQGAKAFTESIERAPEKYQAGLKRLYDEAIDMEHENIAELSTRINGRRDIYRLHLRVPGKNQLLVSFIHLLESGGEISFWRTNDNPASHAQRKITQLVGEPPSKTGIRHRALSSIDDSRLDDILAAIRDLYREANGHKIETTSPDN